MKNNVLKLSIFAIFFAAMSLTPLPINAKPGITKLRKEICTLIQQCQNSDCNKILEDFQEQSARFEALVLMSFDLKNKENSRVRFEKIREGLAGYEHLISTMHHQISNITEPVKKEALRTAASILTDIHHDLTKACKILEDFKGSADSMSELLALHRRIEAYIIYLPVKLQQWEVTQWRAVLKNLRECDNQ